MIALTDLFEDASNWTVVALDSGFSCTCCPHSEGVTGFLMTEQVLKGIFFVSPFVGIFSKSLVINLVLGKWGEQTTQNHRAILAVALYEGGLLNIVPPQLHRFHEMGILGVSLKEESLRIEVFFKELRSVSYKIAEADPRLAKLKVCSWHLKLKQIGKFHS